MSDPFCPVSRSIDNHLDNHPQNWVGEVEISLAGDLRGAGEIVLYVTVEDISDDEKTAKEQIREYVMERITITPIFKDEY